MVFAAVGAEAAMMAWVDGSMPSSITNNSITGTVCRAMDASAERRNAPPPLIGMIALMGSNCIELPEMNENRVYGCERIFSECDVKQRQPLDH